MAGPDFVRFVKSDRVNEYGYPEFALVLFQCKFGKDARWNEAEKSVDPALLYRENR